MIVILVVALVVLGPKRFPSAARTLGRAYLRIKRLSMDLKDNLQEALEDAERGA